MPNLTVQSNENNDLFCPDGRHLNILSGIDACAQATRGRCLIRRGEDIFNTLIGVDYLRNILTSNPDYDAARRDLIREISRGQDIISVESLEINTKGSTFEFTAEILTIYGETEISGEVIL